MYMKKGQQSKLYNYLDTFGLKEKRKKKRKIFCYNKIRRKKIHKKM